MDTQPQQQVPVGVATAGAPPQTTATTTGMPAAALAPMAVPTPQAVVPAAYAGAMYTGMPGMMPSAFSNASLYVGDLRNDVNEQQLFEVFKSVGPITSIRVCRDASRRSLGYAYVNFQNRTDAERVLDSMNFTTIQGKPCRIMWSQRDPALRKSNVGNVFIKNLDLAVDNAALQEHFKAYGKILSLKVETDDNGNSRGYGYIHFEKESEAQAAIDACKDNGKVINGKPVVVGLFQTRQARHADELKEQNFTNVYVKHLGPNVAEDELRTQFGRFGEIVSCIVMKSPKGITRGFGFVGFEKHESAQDAVTEMNDKEVPSLCAKDKKLYVCRAQSKAERVSFLRRKFEGQYQSGSDPAAKVTGCNLYIKNLDDTVTKEELEQLFAPCGKISSAVIMKEERTQTSKGFGFVCFASSEEAAKAVSTMNGSMVHNKPIYVALAQKKAQRRQQLAEQYARNSMYARAPYFPAGIPTAAMYQNYLMGMNMNLAQYPGYPRMVYPQMMGPRPSGRYPPYRQQQGQPQQQMGGQPQGQQQVMPGQPQGQPQILQPQGMPGRQQMQQQQQQQMYTGGGAPPGSRPYRGGNPRAQQQGGGQQQQQQGGAGSQPKRDGWATVVGGGAAAGAGGPATGVKFHATARNQPGMLQQPQQQPQQPPQPQPTAAMVPPQQPPQQVVVENQMVLEEEQELAGMTPEEQKQNVGERLYVRVQELMPAQLHPLCGKITGMLLESLGIKEVLVLLRNQPMLTKRIEEAYAVLEAHRKKVEEASAGGLPVQN